MAESLKPDVITMDINMPHVDGLQATAEIMTTNPKPIVIVSSESREGAASTLRALELGAIEFVAKPSSAIDLDMQSVKEELLRKVRMAAKVRVVRTASRLALSIQNANGPKTSTPSPASVRQAPTSGIDQRFPVVVLAASTGGPATVMRIAPGFTADFPAAVILVQHMPATFTTQYAAQLADFTGIRVKEAEANESLQPGTLYICPGGQHLRVTPTGRIQLDGASSQGWSGERTARPAPPPAADCRPRPGDRRPRRPRRAAVGRQTAGPPSAATAFAMRKQTRPVRPAVRPGL